MVKQRKGYPGKKYHYCAFGLQIQSEVVLPELCAGTSGSVDVNIIYGAVPDAIQSPLEANEDHQAAENEFLFRVDGVASYYVKDGKKIIVQPRLDDNREMRLYLLGTAMGVLLLQRGILPVHGSAIAVDGNCIVFTGLSGAGKSTVAAALRKRGYSLLADDIAAVQINEGHIPWVNPGYPQQKIWQDSASLVGIDTSSMSRVCEDMDKYAVPVNKGFYTHPLPLGVIYEIVEKPCEDIIIEQLTGMEKIIMIINNTYRACLVEGLGLKAAHFRMCALSAQQVPVFRLTRPENTATLSRQVEVLEQHFAKVLKIQDDCVSRIG